MTEPTRLTPQPIEPHVREEAPPDEAVVIIRGGPLTVDKLVEHARRQQRLFTYQGRPMASVSVVATVEGWTVEAALAELLWSRAKYATCSVGQLRAAGWSLLPTHATPHYDIVLPEATAESAGSLLSVFSAPLPNPFKRRKR